jgi:hypothetical protein
MTRYMILAMTMLLTGACALAPARPLMSVWDEESGFGHSERKIEKTVWEVTYVGPFLRTHLNPAQRAGEVKRLRAVAEDLALWRAAEMAKAGKFAALEVETTRSDITVENYNDYPRIVRQGLAHQSGGYLYDQSPGLRFSSAWIQAKAVIVVILKRERGAKDLDAAATAERIARKYPGARTLPAY